MRSHSYVSTAALLAALFATPQLAQAQLLGVEVDIGGDSGSAIDADVTVGGESNGGSAVDAGVNLGGGSGSGGGLVDVDINAGSTPTGTDTDNNLVDVDVDVGTGTVGGSGTGPNGGALIDLNVGPTDAALVDADVNLGGASPAAPSPSSALLNGDVRIGALGDGTERTGALLRLIDNPNLADIDLDAAIDDRSVSIVTAADLLGTDGLADIEAAIALGGNGRTQLDEALSASVELGAILGNEGIDLDDVIAVQVAEDGATEVIILGDTARVAALGDNGNLADLTAADLATLDLDLLSREELAELDLDLLPNDLRTTVQLRLLGVDSADAEPSPAELATIDLDLLSNDALAELDLALLPAPVGTAIEARLLADDGDLADLSVADLAAIDLNLVPTTPGEGGGDDAGGGAPDDGDSGTDAGGDTGNATDPDSDGSGTGTGGNGGNGADSGTTAATSDSSAVSTLPATPVAATLGVAALDCSIGVLALASGAEASPQAIANADSLELVSIDGCARSLVDAEIGVIHSAIAANPAISAVLDDAQIPLDSVIGATIQGGVLTVFIEPALG